MSFRSYWIDHEPPQGKRNSPFLLVIIAMQGLLRIDGLGDPFFYCLLIWEWGWALILAIDVSGEVDLGLPRKGPCDFELFLTKAESSMDFGLKSQSVLLRRSTQALSYAMFLRKAITSELWECSDLTRSSCNYRILLFCSSIVSCKDQIYNYMREVVSLLSSRRRGQSLRADIFEIGLQLLSCIICAVCLLSSSSFIFNLASSKSFNLVFSLKIYIYYISSSTSTSSFFVYLGGGLCGNLPMSWSQEMAS